MSLDIGKLIQGDERVCWEPMYFDESEEAVRMVSAYKSTLESRR